MEKKDVHNRRKALFWHPSGSNEVPKAKQMHVPESDNFAECRAHPLNLPWSTALHGQSDINTGPLLKAQHGRSMKEPFLSL